MGSFGIQSLPSRTFLALLLLSLTISTIESSQSELSLPFPSLVKEIQPTLNIYSTGGDPPCFQLEGGGSATPRDLVRMAGGHGAWETHRVIFITHGYRDSIEDQWLHVMKNALISQRPQTVVLVGWGGGANLPHIKYKKAAGNIRSIGTWLGEFVGELRTMHPKLYIWGIGHSLGAHLMGLAGRTSPRAFDRITGLDPAGPFFETRNEDLRLQRTDANLVDVIHSDGCSFQKNPKCWVAPNNHYATLMPLGTMDFYPNYGILNPTTNPLDIDESHKRAINLFIVSIMHRGLFMTNETLDGTPGNRNAVERIRQVGVVAEMGYWLDTAFIPDPTDSRVNFYINEDIIKVVDRMGDMVQQNALHHAGMRHRRALVKKIECTAMPGGAPTTTPTVSSSLITFSLLILAKCRLL